MNQQFTQARFNMIEQQVRPWNIHDYRVLDVMRDMPREQFTPETFRGLAYADIEIPLGVASTMLAPRIAARYLQALTLGVGDKVLEIGTGSGYLAACMERLGARVISYDLDPVIVKQARDNLADLGCGHIEVRLGNGLEPTAADIPFDGIVITAALPNADLLPQLQEHLAEGGRLVCVIGISPLMECVRITRLGRHEFRQDTLFETCLPPLADLPPVAAFRF